MTDPERSRLDLDALKTSWLVLNEHQRAALLTVARDLAALGPVACEVLMNLTERLGIGAVQYGDFGDNRDWLKEALAEEVDRGVYMLLALKTLSNAWAKIQAPTEKAAAE